MAGTENKQVISFRLDPELISWLKSYAEHFRMSRTSLVEELLTTLREGRLFSLPDTKPDPYPGMPRPEPIPIGQPTPPDNVRPGTYPHRQETQHES